MKNSDHKKKILIIGAGIAGSALYRSLRHDPFDIDFIEKSDTIRSDGGIICLPANTMLELKNMKLDQQVMEKGHQVHEITYALSDGQVLSQASLDVAPLNKAPFISIKRNDLMHFLQQDIKQDIQCSTHATQISQSGSHVIVKLNTGQVKEYDLVIGADGINSTTRSHVQVYPHLKTFGLTTWRFETKCPKENFEPHYYIGNTSAFMIYPAPNKMAYCYGQAKDPLQKLQKMSPRQALEDVFSKYTSNVTKCISQLTCDDHIHVGEIQSVQSTKACENHILLIGDALHGCPPTLQQGAGMALEDVHCLSKALKKMPISDALNYFVQTRSKRIQWNVDESNKIIRLAGLGENFIGRKLRNFVVRRKGPSNVAGWRKLLNEMPSF